MKRHQCQYDHEKGAHGMNDSNLLNGGQVIIDYLILLFGETRQKTDIVFKSSNISFLNLGKIY